MNYFQLKQEQFKSELFWQGFITCGIITFILLLLTGVIQVR